MKVIKIKKTQELIHKTFGINKENMETIREVRSFYLKIESHFFFTIQRKSIW